MRQTYDQFGDAIIAGINEESGTPSFDDSKNKMAEAFAAMEKRMNEKFDALEKNVNTMNDNISGIADIATHTDTDNDTDNSTITDATNDNDNMKDDEV